MYAKIVEGELEEGAKNARLKYKFELQSTLSYPLPFANLQGASPVPLIVFAIATHMMLHPESDLLEVLGLRKSIADARQDATVDYSNGPPPADLRCIQ